MDFRCIVLKDACFDPDPEVHRVLTEKIFPAQATVLTVDAFIAEQGELDLNREESQETLQSSEAEWRRACPLPRVAENFLRPA